MLNASFLYQADRVHSQNSNDGQNYIDGYTQVAWLYPGKRGRGTDSWGPDPRSESRVKNTLSKDSAEIVLDDWVTIAKGVVHNLME